MKKLNRALLSFATTRARIGSIAAAKMAMAYVRSSDSKIDVGDGWPTLWVRGRTEDPAMFSAFVAHRTGHRESLKLLGSPRTIVDAGANVGYFSVLMARAFPDATILAIEPDTSNFEALCKNTAAMPQIKPIRGAVWPRTEPVRLENPEATSIEFRVESAAADGDASTAGTVPGYNVADLLDEHKIDRVDLLKIDIEGGETALFGENTDWLHRAKHLLLELHGDAWRTVFDELSKFDYTCREIPLGGLLIELNGKR
ncbi:MAG: FkbM family methyltransferase [Planctomycetota bacterium]